MGSFQYATLRELGNSRGFRVVKASVNDVVDRDCGPYMVIRRADFAVVLGNSPLFSATHDDVRQYFKTVPTLYHVAKKLAAAEIKALIASRLAELPARENAERAASAAQRA